MVYNGVNFSKISEAYPTIISDKYSVGYSQFFNKFIAFENDVFDNSIFAGGYQITLQGDVHYLSFCGWYNGKKVFRGDGFWLFYGMEGKWVIIQSTVFQEPKYYIDLEGDIQGDNPWFGLNLPTNFSQSVNFDQYQDTQHINRITLKYPQNIYVKNDNITDPSQIKKSRYWLNGTYVLQSDITKKLIISDSQNQIKISSTQINRW